uniref:Stringent starvation protein B n=1 Tax=Candidatus Kentrum sp. FM TaxID=2126340 RepID=A0A450TRR0_9GAMM|nr:MAG: stringent starvation protein B [Candidatus Kentron sp. FM]VFJ70979.1 MAG: stringent starvation protein B [Candidatus Kentron sp. FM]VFK08499.1 MAG: stringent starvation protein B [Candidatus Kentron sp. FM]
MTSTRPYLIRAIHEWILDNNLTPYILVNTKVAGLLLPGQYIDGDEITFNISSSATKDLYLGNEEVEFSARFRGTPTFVRVPTKAILAVYAKETGAGMAFQEEPSEQGVEEEDKEAVAAAPRKSPEPDAESSRPALRIVK